MKTDAHVSTLFREFAATGKVGVASLRADMWRQTGSKWLKAGVLPSDTWSPRTYSTWPDPFEKVDSEIDTYLDKMPGILGTDMMRLLELRHAGEYSGSLRTLQRRLKVKRARSRSKELFFAQVHHPGEWFQVDWANMNGMGITINGDPFAHKICHGVFAYSSVEHVSVCTSESFASLETFVHEAALGFGGLPSGLQLDNSSVVTHREGPERVFNERFRSLLDHYGLEARTINIRKPNENGCVEVSHGHFRRHVEVALALRESRDFESEDAYRLFIDDMVNQRNSTRWEAWNAEFASLKPVAKSKLKRFRFELRRVDQGGLVHLESQAYSVPSSYVGEWLDCRISRDVIELFYGAEPVRTITTADPPIDWRHLIVWMKRKPGAFADYVHRSAFFPEPAYERFYEHVERDDRRYLACLEAIREADSTAVEAAVESAVSAQISSDDVELFLRLHLADAGVGELQDNPVMDQPVDGGHAGHGVFEDPIPPLGKDQITADDQAAPLVAVGQEVEEQLHFVTPMLHVTQLINNDQVELVQTFELLLQTKILTSTQQTLHQPGAWGEQYVQPVTHHQFAPQSGGEMSLATPRQTETEQVFPIFDERSVQQARQHPPDLQRQQLFIQIRQCLTLGQTGGLEQTFRFSPLPILELRFAQVGQEFAIAPVLGLRLAHGFIRQSGHRGQTERLEIHA